MKTIFISWYDGFLDQNINSLFQSLNKKDLTIVTSPYSPHCGLGHDPKRDNWYDSGLDRQISTSDIYIACITDSWSGSSWMGQELLTAYKSFRKNNKPKIYHIRFKNCEIDKGFLGYLKSSIELPEDHDEALKILSRDIL